MSERSPSRVAVVGGGVVGLCVALDLARAGAEVVLLERETCGGAASQGNGGWVTPTLSAPLAEPGAIALALRALRRRDSPFSLRPRLDPALAAWGWQFWRASSRERWRAGAAALLALNARTMAAFDELRAGGVEFEMHTDGLLFVARTDAGLAGVRASLAALSDIGSLGTLEEVGTDALRTREPALADGLAGAIHAHGERHVRPELLARGLAEAATRSGAVIHEHTTVTGLFRSNGSWLLTTGDVRVVADRIVVAAGSASGDVLRPLAIRLPLEGAKGYSVTSVGEGLVPRRPLYLAEAKVGFSPFDGAARLAGTLELGGRDTRVRRRRIDGIVSSAAGYLRTWRPAAAAIEWAGVRPLAPDGLPLIGAVPGQDGLFLATGHGMLGVTLGPATADALTPLVLENRLVPELVPFRPGRFPRIRARGRPTRHPR